MHMKMDKRKQQVVALVIVLALIVGSLFVFYWRNLLPQPVGGEAPPAAKPRLDIGAANYDQLFKRDDFRRLSAFGDVPVKVLPADGNPNLFVSREQLEGGADR